ncbi:MAG: XamI family restriction endonuclease [Candidatus Aquicultor secundus]|uniref:XamI family restriction endonuclease n=1 Tax=Candidatus Aquicultor secundus TaxID=1973895 RepID=A0A2M7T7W9_9ACTN|nr:XamI family restriction endonuclease [Candidatus Aquicultor secundus]OIO83761.1 MAG: restriction endonuclease [Candidatus Aquicultor secundus]PIU26163.1 MAG: XamI family restriction endonuclease [Candidatus Aquicultor secundus]PIW22643.1 MAG: XamI family restriction endonuclease [Candidatus Aquicultor secundus]PIZ38788.1 MAG: XamI family restriction endonuclease [Candidatus Aquicultor secundus]
MAINADKPTRWKSDIAQSVDCYNDWFMKFAPKAYRDTRVETTQQVESALEKTNNLKDISPSMLHENPSVLPILRMSTAPPIARDRLIGLAGISPHLVKCMELDCKIPPKTEASKVNEELKRIGDAIMKLADKDIFTWLETEKRPAQEEINRAATIVADRLCGAVADPIIRNAQEKRQLSLIKEWLERREYTYISAGEGLKFNAMQPGTFAFHLNVPVKLEGGETQINIPIDVAVMPLSSKPGDLPLLIEAKSAGNFTNVNKRRKEEAIKVAQLRRNYGKDVRFILFLCGYFDSGYLGYEAAEGIDWVWEHRIDDLAEFGV